jgi:hypothetical protein
MFDSNEMLELRHVKADRYQRAGGGGAHKVYNTAKAYDDARGYREMSPYRRACYEATILWRLKAEEIISDFKWCVRADRVDIEMAASFPSIPFGAIYHVIAATF